MKTAFLCALALVVFSANAKPLEPAHSLRTMPVQQVKARQLHLQTVQQKIVRVSWYGKHYAGRPTASGVRFNPGAMTAAHRTLKLGTRVRVTNPHNGTSVVVTINDRGPYVRGRDLDLSEAAAQSLGVHDRGVAKLFMEIL